MGEYIRVAPLIVIADVSPPTAPKYEQILTVREVLKGQAMVGDRITVLGPRTSHFVLPREVQNAAILFAPDWNNNPSPVAAVYSEPREIAALRELITIYALPDERTQLLALQARVSNANPLFATQLIADFAKMRETANFDIVLSSFDRLGAAHQAALLELLGSIGDRRSVPLLIAALQSPDSKVRYTASHALTFTFPGAPGVTEAFRSLVQSPDNRKLALHYLSKHDPALAATFPKPPPTLWQQAHQKLENGEIAAAKEIYFGLIEKEGESNWSSLNAARTLLPHLDEVGKLRLRTLLASFLERETDSYLDAETGIALLRSLRNEKNTPALLHLLHDPTENPYSAWGGASRAATFALLELGPKARQTATKLVLQEMRTRLAPDAKPRFNEEILYFCQLAWLADDATWQAVQTELPENWKSRIQQLQPLRDAANSKHEAAALAALLPDKADRWQGDANRWIIARLGELRDSVAVSPLFAELERSRFSGISGDIVAALSAIGGSSVENGALKLLEHEYDDLRRHGMDILRGVQGEKMRPLLRRILTEDGLGDRPYAVFLLGYLGQPEDLPLLEPLADFWKSDRTIQARAVAAMVTIRDRFAYDINGPIIKLSK